MEMTELMAKGKELLKNKDPEAKELFEEAVKQGNGKANYYLATIYRFGVGVDADIKKAFDLYKKAASAGSNPALYQLAKLTETGRGCKKSEKDAKNYYLQAAEAGYPKAQLELAKILEKEFDKSKVREENENKRALKIINENRRPVKALNKAKESEEETTEVVYKIESDISNADCIRWYQAYVDATHDEDATLHLAYLYEIGKGVQKDDDKAVELYSSIANQGNQKVMLRLAKKFQLEGKVEQALTWYTKLYEAGDEKAAYLIALLYEENNDKVKAGEWYQVSADLGNYDAKHKLQSIKGKPVTYIVGQEEKKDNNRRSNF